MKTRNNLINKAFGIAILWLVSLIANAQGNFDIEVFKEQLSSSVQDDIKGRIEEEVKNWLSAGEAKALEQVYWKEMLEPYAEFGIDPEGKDYYQSALEIYNSIKNDPEYDPKTELKGKLSDMLNTRLENELKKITGQYIDAESQEIITQWQNLYQGATEKTNKILSDLNKIGEWDPNDSDYESKVESLVRTWGIKGKLADFIGEMDAVYNKLNDSYGTQVGMGLEVLNMIRDDDPTNKIEAMFQFGMDYGDKIPLVGSIVSNLFAVGKELLAAAKRAGSMIDQNIAQGCFYGVGAHGSALLSQSGRKKEEFQRLFPNVVSACPMSQDPNSGVYQHIYIDQGNGRNVFFYFGNHWHGLPSNNGNSGADDVRAIIQWLRRIQSNKYNDIETIYNIFIKTPGFTEYRNQIESNVKSIQSLVRKNLSGNSYCNESDLEEYLFEAVDLNWIKRLIGSDQLPLARAKIFDDGLIEQVADQMQENRYLKGGQANLNHLENIANNLREKVPVYFTGRVIDNANNRALEGARITPPDLSNLIFDDERCQRLVTNSNGEYMFFALLSPSRNNKVAIMASYEGISLAEEFDVNVASRQYYNFNIYLRLSEEEGKSPKEECEEKEGYVWDDEQEICVPALDCTTEENTTRVLNVDKSAYICDCLSPFTWNEDRTKCISAEEVAKDSTFCEDPNAEIIDGECLCKEGYSKNYLGNCEESGGVYTSLQISPQTQTIGVGDDPVLIVLAINVLGETVDVTDQALENTSSIGDISGVFTVKANLQGFEATAEVIVNECSDPNATLNTITGDCDCKEGYQKDEEGLCAKDKGDSTCPFPNMKQNKAGECECQEGYLPAENGGCISEEELLTELEGEAMEDCPNLESLTSELSALLNQVSYAYSDFKSHSERFFKEVNDRASDLCQNQVAAYSYAQALAAFANLTGAIEKGKDSYFGVQILGQCPNYEQILGNNGLNNFDLSVLLDQATESELILGDMGSRIKENGCNEEDLEDTGRTIVDQDKDPELISLGGTGIELQGDGKDNDGDGQEDEIPVSAESGYNVTIVIYDSGQAKDDVFSLNVDGIGDLGTTPEGGLRSYPLQLPLGTYEARVTVLEDGGDVGTFTINVLVDGVSVASLVGQPTAGGSESVHFSVEE